MTETMELAKALAENEKLREENERLREANKQLVSGIYTITRRKQEENERLREELRQALKELAAVQQFSDYLAGSDR